MDSVINDFVRVLRRHQLRVSPAESLDALHALQQVGLGERKVVRDALRATMVKNQEDSETFDRLFDLFFSIRLPKEKRTASFKLPEHDHDHGPPPAKLELGEDAEGEAPEEEGHSHDEGDPVDMRRFFDEERIRSSRDIHGEAKKMRLSMFSQELILNHEQGALQSALQRLTYHMRIRRSRNLFNPGGLVPTAGEEIPLDVSAVDLQDFVDHLHEMEVDEALIAQLEAQSENILRGLPELIKQMQEREKKLEKGAKDDSEFRQRSLRKMLDFSAGEQREMEAAIRRIARRIYGAKTRRLRKDRIGRISVPHTLRHNVRYGGVPFDPVLRRRREGR